MLHRLRIPFLLTVVALIGAGCGSSSSQKSGANTAKRGPWCQAQPDKAWRDALAGGLVSLSRKASIEPLADAGDGHSFYAELSSKDYSGIVRVDASTSRYTKIQPIARPAMFRAIGAVDGRWFVWVGMWRNATSGPDYSRWEIWSWDSGSERLRKLAAEPNAARTGNWFSGSRLSARDGYVLFVHAEGRETVLEAADLASGRSKTVSRGKLVSPLFLLPKHVAVWEELDETGDRKKAKIAAADVTTGKRVPLPQALRAIDANNASDLTSAGAALLYSRLFPQSLWWTPSLDLAPRRVVAGVSSFEFENSLNVSGDYALFSDQPKVYLANGKDGRYLRIASDASALLGDRALIVVKEPTDVLQTHTDVSFLPLASLPAIPPCR